MRDDDVRLTEDERAAFAEIERHLGAKRRRLSRWRSVWRRAGRTLPWWSALLVGVALLVVGLVVAGTAVALIGYGVTLVATWMLSRRLDGGRAIRWWRRHGRRSGG